MWMAWRSASGDNGIHEICDNCYAYEKVSNTQGVKVFNWFILWNEKWE